MPFFNNKRKDFSIQPPKQSIANGAFTVTDSANIDFTYASDNLSANLTLTGITAGTYGDATHIPVLTLDSYGRVTGVSTTTFSATGIALEVNGTPNLSQTILNLTSGTDIQVVDLGGGVIEFNYTGTGGSGTVTSVSAGTGMNFTTITTSGAVAIDTTKVPYIPAGFTTGLLKWDSSNWVFDNNTYLTSAVTSVDLTMPPAFSVTGNPITTAGTLAVAAAGLSTQYIRGDGQLANFPTSTGGGSSVSYYLNGSVSQGTFGGVAFREMSKTAIFGAGTNFSINADGYIQSFITDANDPNQLLIPAGNWNFEMYFNASSGGGSPTFYVELYKWDGAALTLIASSSANPEGITNGTTVDLYVTALGVPSTVLAATDRLAVRVWVNHSGRTITLHTEDSNLCEIITTFSTGLTALNGLTTQVQLLATGTSGTDFNISSATATHTFNIPSSSALNRGLLLAADWSIFNGKQNALTDTKSVKIVSNNVELDGDLATPLANYVYGTNGTGVKGWKPDPSSGGTIGFKVPTITEIMSTTLALTNSIEYVASVDKLYVANGNNNVNIFNATTGELLSTVLLTQALRVRYISSINEIWATSVNVASITRISPTTNASLGTITIGIEANGYDILEISSTKVYVSITTNGAQKIQIINPTTLTWVSNITASITNFASGMALNSNPSSAQNGIVILVTSGAGSVNLINSTTNIVIATVTPGGMSNCFEVAYSAADDKYYIASQGNGRIISLNITGLTTLTLDKIKNNAFLTISLQIDDTNDLLIINQVANSSSNLANMCHFIKKSTFESLYNIITPAAGGGGSRAGSVKLDLPNKRVFLTGRSAGSLPVVTLKY